MGSEQLPRLVEKIKTRVMRSVRRHKNQYVKMVKTSTVKVEIKSRKACDRNLKAADRPGKASFPLCYKIRVP